MCSVSSAPVNPETIVCKKITGKRNFGLPVSTKGTNSKDLIQVGIKKKKISPPSISNAGGLQTLL